ATTALSRLAAAVPLLPGADRLAIVDLDSKLTRVFGRTKAGAKFGHKKVRGLDFLAATVATPGHAPVIAATRLRGGNADTRRNATTFANRAVRSAREAGATGTIIVRGDSGFYVGELIAALTAQGVLFSVTARQSKGLLRVIAAIDENLWTPITYDTPVYDEHTGEAIHTAQIAETTHTAFTNPTTNPGQKTTARLIVRRTRATAITEQGELFTTWRYHAIFTNSDLGTLAAETQHRARAGAIEHVFADLESSALAHFPSAHFHANAAWLTLAALAHNLTRAAGVLAGGEHARARIPTLRRQLIAIPARITHTARTLTLRLPTNWRWQHNYQRLFTATHTRTA
ncbi:IS1380 family transposase, partial [Amycolatopsis sp. NPDC059657]|uniref:IS1380 family transposase n=1 Tax=Amycolatopsis sp. NPDC059657 TaxID=3346899 RepID=UPI00366CAE4F